MKALRFFTGTTILVLSWYLISLMAGPDIFPFPHQVFYSLIFNENINLFRHILFSIKRILLALFFSSAAAIPLGIILGRMKILDALFTPGIYLLYPVPKITLLPIIMLLFGIGDSAKIILISLVLFFQILLPVRDKVYALPRGYIISIASLGAERKHILKYLIFPYILPTIFTSLRIGIGTALAVLFFAETFFTSYGVGYFIVDSWMRSSYINMFSGIFILSVLGLVLFGIIDFLERYFCRWNRAAPREFSEG